MEKIIKNTKHKNIKSMSGITLIALVITIIVLLILAGVSINMISDNNNILKLSVESKDITAEKTEDEMQKIDSMGVFIDEYLGLEEVPEGMVARIGATYYETLEEAISNVPENEKTEIVVLDDITEDVEIQSNKSIVLRLNGKTISSNATDVATITNYGILTVSGKGTINSVNTEALQNKAGTVIINGDFTFSTNNDTYGTIYNSVIKEDGQIKYGELSITGGNINLETNYYKLYGISNYGEMTITGGNITATKGCGILSNGTDGGTLTISGNTNIISEWTTIHSYHGATTITSATITSVAHKAIDTYGATITINEGTKISNGEEAQGKIDTITVYRSTLTVNGGEIKALDSWAINNAEESTVVINGGTISNNSTSCGTINNAISSANLTITNGTVKNNMEFIVILIYGTTEISGGSVNNQSDEFPTIYNKSGSLTVTGGTINNASTVADAYEIADNTNTMVIDDTIKATLRIYYGSI